MLEKKVIYFVLLGTVFWVNASSKANPFCKDSMMWMPVDRASGGLSGDAPSKKEGSTKNLPVLIERELLFYGNCIQLTAQSFFRAPLRISCVQCAFDVVYPQNSNHAL